MHEIYIYINIYRERERERERLCTELRRLDIILDGQADLNIGHSFFFPLLFSFSESCIGYDNASVDQKILYVKSGECGV